MRYGTSSSHNFFRGAKEQIPLRAITGLTVKQAEIALPNPT